jgi:hypothetical protein
MRSLPACAGHASSQVLECDGTSWVHGIDCASGTLCDSSTAGMQGRCRPVVAACANQVADAKVCDNTSGMAVSRCGIDLVTATNLTVCSGTTPICKDAACTCATPCGGQCADLQQDSNNCGACAHSCQGGACLEGKCQPQMLATASFLISQLAVDSSGIYYTDLPETSGGWTSSSVGQLIHMGLDGSNPTSIASDGFDTRAPQDVTLDGSNAYWVLGGGGLLKVPHGSSAGTALSGSNVYSTCVAVSSGFAYYNGPSQDSNDPSYSVVKQSVQAGAPQYLMNAGGAFTEVAADARFVYWTDDQAGTVKKLSTSGGTPVVIAAGEANAYAIAVDANNLYWTAGSPRALKKMPLSGGSVVTLAPGANESIALDATYVYFASGSGVARVPIAGGPTEILSNNVTGAYLVAVDANSAYVSTLTSPPRIYKLAK